MGPNHINARDLKELALSIRYGSVAEMTPGAIMLSVVPLLPRSIVILSPVLEILAIINLLNQSKNIFHLGFGA